MSSTKEEQIHVPVLLEAVLRYLDPKEGESYLDLTAGYGGHATKILERTKSPQKATLIDRDQHAIEYLEKVCGGSGATIIKNDFLSASRHLLENGQQFDLILADLGVSSPHLNNASRGFSIRLDGPLDMRMDQLQQRTAAEIVNTMDAVELAGLLRRYGEEPRAKKIARLIVEHRPIITTAQLAIVAAHAWPGHSKVHPATRTFQALRIAVNDELRQLEDSLPLWINLLAPGGRIAIISFHSLEDRLVKHALAEQSGNRYDAILRLLTRQPVSGDPSEIVFNPRARSAKLRAAVKIKNKKKGE